MSSAQGFPDWQRITQWLGPPIVQNTGLVIGAALHTDGPFQVSNFASVMVALKATGGNVTVTVKQTVPAGPASLVLTETVIVPAGSTLFEAFVLFGGAVELDLTGSVAGTSVDYALYGSNTTTNAQVITQATINVQHNDVLIAAESALDFEDAGTNVWTVVDDGPGTRVKVTPIQLVAAGLGIPGGQAIPNNVATAVALLQAYDWTQGGGWAARGGAVAPVAVPVAGIYAVEGYLQWPPIAGIDVSLGFALATALVNRIPLQALKTQGSTTSGVTVNALFELAAGDTVALQAYQNSGGNLTPANGHLVLARVA